MARSWWTQADVSGFAGYRICKNLQILKVNIKRWNKEVFGCIEESREALSKVVENIDKKGEQQELSPEEVSARQQAVGKIWDLNRWEEISWRQIYRVNWLKEGDKNTKFFHRMANVRSIVNFLRRIRRDGRSLETLEIKNEVVHLFEELYKGENVVRPYQGSFLPLSLNGYSKLVGKGV